MKKILCILTVLAMAFSLLSCSTDNEPMEYQIYCSSALDASEIAVNTENESHDVSFIHWSELEFEFASLEEIEVENSEKTKKITIDGIDWEFEYSRSYVTYCSESNVEELSGFERVDIYHNATHEAYIWVNPKTGEIIKFRNRMTDPPEFGDFTLEQAEKKSEEIFRSLFGEELLEKYTFEYSEYHQYVSGGPDQVWVQYEYRVCGLPTNDYIRFIYDLNGDFTYFNAPAFGTGEIIEKNVTEEKIEAAKEAFKEALPNEKNWKVNCLMFDVKTGTCFLEIFTSDVYYINVTPLQDSPSE